jgi:hypothetical protein
MHKYLCISELLQILNECRDVKFPSSISFNAPSALFILITLGRIFRALSAIRDYYLNADILISDTAPRRGIPKTSHYVGIRARFRDLKRGRNGVRGWRNGVAGKCRREIEGRIFLAIY